MALNGFDQLAQPREEIIVTMPDGSERKGQSWETSPMDIAKEVSKSLSERVVIAKVRPIPCAFFREDRHSSGTG